MFALLPQRAASEKLGITWHPAQYVTAPRGSADPPLPVWDELAAPTVFLELCLVYPQLDSACLKAALHHSVDAYPALAARLFTSPQDGQLCLKQAATAGAAFMEGHAPNLTLQQLLEPVHSSTSLAPAPATQPNSSSSSSSQAEPPKACSMTHTNSDTASTVPLVPLAVPELPALVFGHLPGALIPAYLNQPTMPLASVALVHLAGGGCVLGLRLSHLLGDGVSLRLLLRQLTQGYTYALQQKMKVQVQEQPQAQDPEKQQERQQPETKEQEQEERVERKAQQQPRSHPIVQPQECLNQELQQLAVTPHTPQAAGEDAAEAAVAASTAGGVLPAAVEPSAAGLLRELVDIGQDMWAWEAEPFRLKLLEPADGVRFAALAQLSSRTNTSSSNGGGPVRLAYLAPPAFIQRLKAEAAAAAAAAAAEADAGGDAPPAAAASAERGSATSCDILFEQRHTISYDATFSTHNVLLSCLFKAFCKLPGRQLLPHDLSVSIDMRPRINHAIYQQLPQEQRGMLPRAFGNLFAAGMAEALLPQELSLADLAERVAYAIKVGATRWLPDLVWASGIMAPAKAPGPVEQTPAAAAAAAAGSSGVTALPPVPEASAASFSKMTPPKLQAVPPEQPGQQQQQQQVTWRRLHAMGPRSHLEQQVLLGCIPALSTTQWPVDEGEDACLGGQAPLLCVPGFSQPQPYPLVLSLKAPQRLGGGVLLHLFLDRMEVDAMKRLLEAS